MEVKNRTLASDHNSMEFAQINYKGDVCSSASHGKALHKP